MSTKLIEKPPIESLAGRRTLARKLLAWFDRHARDLPWRQTSDLYAIWISEIMLQQTQVATVIPYWKRFLARFPDAATLAAADEQEVLRLWEGLGYYRRARQLHAAARQIAAAHGGQFPATLTEVRALPGIGRYTAGAILSIGLDQRLPILEANTIRVLSRLSGFEGDPAASAGQKHLWSVAEAILPSARVGAFNQALMELGSELCTPRAPACDRCPVATLCAARQRGITLRIPRPPAKTRFEEVTEAAVVIRHRGRVLVRHCQRGERWAGLWDFPRFALLSRSAEAGLAELREQTRALTGLAIDDSTHLTTIRHGVTRYRITLHCYAAKLAGAARAANRSGNLRWLQPGELTELPLSTTGRKIARLIGA
jgi:A/G-specific adenine glycosylase